MAKKINSFKTFYDQLNDADKRKLREKIIEDLELSENNFYWRLRRIKWKAIEKMAIAKAAKKPLTELFPELQTA